MVKHFDPQTPVGSYHPGHPRFVTVGEPIRDPVFVIAADDTGLSVDASPDAHDRDNLAPRLPELDVDPENYPAEDFRWSVVETPPESDGDVLSFATSTTAIPRHDSGRDNVAEFEADAPGEFVLALDAPDGTHELTIWAFPEPEDEDRNPPLVGLNAEYEDGAFVVESNAQPAPSTSLEDISVTFLADDRDALATDDIEVGADELTATIPAAALDDDSARVHAAAYNGNRRSVQDSIELHPDGSVGRPNRPPEWAIDGVIYQIFPRSWAGERGETTFETLIEGDEAAGARGVEYLDELGVDVVWLTPIVPATSARRDRAGGGPHGYGTIDYLAVAEDLVPAGYDDPVAAYEDFVVACHEHDIKVLFDLVISHAGRPNELFQSTIAEQDDEPEYWPTVRAWNEDARTFDWWDRVDARRYDDDGELLEERPRPTGFADIMSMPNLNYGTVALREYVLAVADFWSREVDVDGFRCDVAFGVPHSFWKEVREVVRANDSDFLMLDETIPNDPAFSENEFDMHFDTRGFTYAAQDVADADESARDPADRLLDAVLARWEKGHPEYSLIINALENHDEFRLLNQAVIDPADPEYDEVSEAEWERAAQLQRACFAAAVTLPGVPLVYYGQERQISRYGENRHEGVDQGDERGLDDQDEIVTSQDVRPGGRQRAFMNWTEYNEAHRQFYEDLINLYHEMDGLHPHANTSRLSADTDADVLLFGRGGGDPAGSFDPRAVVVAVNFEADPVEVELPTDASDTTLVSQNGIAKATDDSVTQVDTLALFEVSSLSSVEHGIEIRRIEDG